MARAAAVLCYNMNGEVLLSGRLNSSSSRRFGAPCVGRERIGKPFNAGACCQLHGSPSHVCQAFHPLVLAASSTVEAADKLRPVFEPRMDPTAAAAEVAVLAISIALGAYWWLVIVPSERASLAREKRRGTVGEYLQEVSADPARKAEQWFYADWLRSSWFKALSRRSKQAQAPQDAADSEASLSEPANDNLLQPSFQTPTPKFFSLDNPIIATAAGLIVIGTLSSLSH